MTRAYSIFHIKSFDEDLREISGIASTPSPDRSRDIVVPEGAKFAEEIPLLWQHDHDKPIGTARLGPPSKAGIPFSAKIEKIAEPGELKSLLDRAWQSIKAGLVRGISIGFRSLSHEYMDDGGIKFTEYEIFELSAVTIPANAEATITNIKHIVTGTRVSGPVKLVDIKQAPLPGGAVRIDATLHDCRMDNTTVISLKD